MLKRTIMECNYKKNSVEPCKTCPRKITALYMCKLLQETAELAQKDLKETKEELDNMFGNSKKI